MLLASQSEAISSAVHLRVYKRTFQDVLEANINNIFKYIKDFKIIDFESGDFTLEECKMLVERADASEDFDLPISLTGEQLNLSLENFKYTLSGVNGNTNKPVSIIAVAPTTRITLKIAIKVDEEGN